MTLNRPAGHSNSNDQTPYSCSDVITAVSFLHDDPNVTPKIVSTRLQRDGKIKNSINPSESECLPQENIAPSVGYSYSFKHIGDTVCQSQPVHILAKDLQVGKCQELPFRQSTTPMIPVKNSLEKLSQVRKTLENRTEAALSIRSLLESSRNTFSAKAINDKRTHSCWDDVSTEYLVDTWKENFPSNMSVRKGLNREDAGDTLLYADECKRWKDIKNALNSNIELKISPRKENFNSNRSQSSNETDLEMQKIWNRRTQPELQTPRTNVNDILERCREYEIKLSESGTFTNPLIREIEHNAAMKTKVKAFLSKYSASYTTSEEMPSHQDCDDSTLYNYGFRKLHADSVSENQSYYTQLHTPQQHPIVPKTQQSVFMDYTSDQPSHPTENAYVPICSRYFPTLETEPKDPVILCDNNTALRDQELNAQKSAHAIHTFGSMDEEKQPAELLLYGKYTYEHLDKQSAIHSCSDHTDLVPDQVSNNIPVVEMEDEGSIEAHTEQTFPTEKECVRKHSVEITAEQNSNVEVDLLEFQSIKNSTDSNGLKASCNDLLLDTKLEDSADPENRRHFEVSDLKTAANARNYSQILEECPTKTENQVIKQALKNKTSRMQCQFIGTDDVVAPEYKIPLRDQDYVKIATAEKACLAKEERPFNTKKSKAAIKERWSRKEGLLREAESQLEMPVPCTEKHAAQLIKSLPTNSSSHRDFIKVEWKQGQKIYNIPPLSLAMANARERIPNTRSRTRKMSSPGSRSTRTTTSKNKNAAPVNGIIRNSKSVSFAELPQQVPTGTGHKTSSARTVSEKGMSMVSGPTLVHSKRRCDSSSSSISKSNRNMNLSHRREKKINSNSTGFSTHKKSQSVTGQYGSTSERNPRSTQTKNNNQTQNAEFDGKQSSKVKNVRSETIQPAFSAEEVVSMNADYTQVVDELLREKENVKSNCSSETTNNSDHNFTFLDKVKELLKSWVPGRYAKVSRSCSNTHLLQATISTD